MANKELPIAKYELELIDAVKNNQVVIIYGETGSGKTTQIPQYLLKSRINKNLIIGITQPRKIGALSMSKRVSEEMETALGTTVGYEIRFDNKSDNSTKIKYMTEGILINHCMTDTMLPQYGVIMIDEAHERSAYSDVLLGLLKRLLSVRTDLKVIITSSTMETERFSSYFNNAPILNIEGRLFDIRLIYECPTDGKYVTASSDIVKRIHKGNSDGDILIFFTGRDEISECCGNLEGIPDLIVLPVHATMDTDTQERVFMKVPKGKRKVVVATNVAENTITIDNIRFVIDCGYVRQNNFNSKVCMNEMEQIRISKAQADQRKGRCGRTVDGCCFRLYSEKVYNEMLEQAVPEITRVNLGEIYLRIVTVGMDPLLFDFIDAPNKNNLRLAEKELMDLSLIDDKKRLTDLGKKMRNLPVDPVLGVVLLSSYNFYCAEDVVTIMSLMNEPKLIIRYDNKDGAENNPQTAFHDLDGDHFMRLNMFTEFVRNGNKKPWCDDHYINYDAMVQIIKERHQLMTMMRTVIPLDEYSTSTNRNNIKMAIIKGYYTNICKKISNGKYISLSTKETLFIHPGSCLKKESPDLILYHEISKTTNAYMHGILKLDKSILVNFTNEMDKLGITFNDLSNK